jgi:hypothetical protein
MAFFTAPVIFFKQKFLYSQKGRRIRAHCLVAAVASPLSLIGAYYLVVYQVEIFSQSKILTDN